jgi:hypothetical protein
MFRRLYARRLNVPQFFFYIGLNCWLLSFGWVDLLLVVKCDEVFVMFHNDVVFFQFEFQIGGV